MKLKLCEDCALQNQRMRTRTKRNIPSRGSPRRGRTPENQAAADQGRIPLNREHVQKAPTEKFKVELIPNTTKAEIANKTKDMRIYHGIVDNSVKPKFNS
jgi:hypothetical protein